MSKRNEKSAVRVRRVVSRMEADVCDSIWLRGAYGATARSADAVAELLAPLIGEEAVEVFVTLLLDGKHRVTGVAEVSRGTLTSSLVHPREVFGPVVRCGAAAIIVAHNHPSGDPEPSSDDISVTLRLIAAAGILGIPLLDHLVLGAPGAYVSLRARMDF